MKLEYKPEDFSFDGGLVDRQCHVSANQANKLLPEIKEAWKAEMLKDAVVVYGRMDSFIFSPNEESTTDTHKALLINIEPIFKECVKHEPEARYWINGEFSGAARCKYCSVDLIVEWREK